MEAIKFLFGELKLTNEVINRISDLGYTPESLKEAVKNHEQTNGSDEPALYCGTYGKYNSGNFRGMWVDLSTFDSYEDFINFCYAIHADEEDPELMAQDYACFPGQWYKEGFMSEDDFDKIIEYSDICDKYGREAVDDYMELHDEIDNFEEAYCGEYDSKEDFAEELVNDCYNLDDMMGNLSCYFDYEKFARDLFMCDYDFGSHGTVFRAI